MSFDPQDYSQLLLTWNAFNSTSSKMSFLSLSQMMKMRVRAAFAAGFNSYNIKSKDAIQRWRYVFQDIIHWQRGMKNSLGSEIKHFGNVDEFFCRALNTCFNFLSNWNRAPLLPPFRNYLVVIHHGNDQIIQAGGLRLFIWSHINSIPDKNHWDLSVRLCRCASDEWNPKGP